ncbi:MAG TPA: hypothetical protein VH560_15445 [Polyangia bacterium]|jgi:hypothetical protein|nr:hypothetical protein [Polyangia bacterium]
MNIKSTTNSLSVKTSIKAGGLINTNHNRALKVRSAIKAGGLINTNHNRALKV